MRIGLIDVDNYKNIRDCFPNLVIMKLSTYHKQKGDLVEWYDPFAEEYDKVYMSKVFSFTEEYPFVINAKEIIGGGTGYCISLKDGKEVFDKTKNTNLPYEIEHCCPDYSIYGIENKAYGFLTRGCPRGCAFCHTGAKDGLKSHKTANLSEFWNGQKEICLLDQNILACCEWKELLQQLIDSKAKVEFNGGLDIRMITEEKAEMLKQIKTNMVHFAWDRYEDKDIVVPRFKWIKEKTGWGRNKVSVYVLCNFNTTMEQNLERIYFLRSLNFSPYVMLYDKEHIPRGHELKKLQRWCNNRMLFWSNPTFEDYKRYGG